MKRALSLIVVLALVLVMVPFSVFAETQELPEYGVSDEFAMGAYSYTWTAPSDGTATFQLGSLDGYEVIITDKNEMELANQVNEWDENVAVANNVAAGDVFTINIVVTAETAYVYVSVACEAPLGSETNPYTYMYGEVPVQTPIVAPWSEETVWMSFYFVDAADQPYTSVFIEGPVQVTYNGETYTADEATGGATIPLVLDTSYGRPVPFATFGITNMGRAAMAFQMTFSAGEGGEGGEEVEQGTMENPAAIQAGDNWGSFVLAGEVNLEENDEDGYWFQWTNDQNVDGIAVFNWIGIIDEEWEPVSGNVEVEVINPETYVSSSNALYDTTADGEEIYNNPLMTVRIPAGHILKVHVYTDGAWAEGGTWACPAAYVSFEGQFMTDEDEMITIQNGGKAFKAPVAAGDTVSFVDFELAGKGVTISGNAAAMEATSVKVLYMSDWGVEYAEAGTYTADETGKINFNAPMGVAVKLEITNNYAYNTNYVITRMSPVIIETEDGVLSFDSIEEALDAAEAGQTVKLNADATADILVIKPGVTLDLGVYDLTAEGLVGLTGSYLNGTRYSSSGDYGKLIVPQDKLVMTGGDPVDGNGSYKIMPIWNGEDAYVLTQGYINDQGGNYGLVVDEEAKTIEFRFTHVMGGSANNAFLSDGSDDNALKIVVRLTWENENGVAYQDFVYNADFVGLVVGGGYNYTFALNGYDALNINIENLTVTAMFITDCGIVVSGQTF